MQIGFSIGVCQFTTSMHTFETLYELADQAMYQVKKNGKNGVEYINLSQ
nr:diguanylate cyclase [Vibrio anguillarum]